jgi:transposase-like protein
LQVDRGVSMNFMLRARREVAAAKAFFRKVLRHHGQSPETITQDGYAASHPRGARDEDRWSAA